MEEQQEGVADSSIKKNKKKRERERERERKENERKGKRAEFRLSDIEVVL